jgi:hypothetical protein
MHSAFEPVPRTAGRAFFRPFGESSDESTLEIQDFLPESVAHGRFEVHSDGMNDSGPGGGGYFWCLRDNRVETGDDMCPAQYRLGPYATADDATRALETVEKRNAEWDAEDARWTGEDS